jgi:hypothetical protein
MDESADTRPSDSASLNSSINSSTASYDQSKSSIGGSQASQSMSMSTTGTKATPASGAPVEKEIDKEKLLAQVSSFSY